MMIKVRAAQPTDAAEIARLCAESGAPREESALETALTTGALRATVADAKRELAGVCLSEIDGDSAQLRTLWAGEDYKFKSLEERMLTAHREELSALGLRLVE